MTKISDPSPTPETFDLLSEIIETRALPHNTSLERMAGYEPDDSQVFDVWSIRLRITRDDGSSFVVSIREQMISSRVMGPEEREVVRRWRERSAGGIGSMERAELMKRFRDERAAATQRDSDRDPQ